MPYIGKARKYRESTTLTFKAQHQSFVESKDRSVGMRPPPDEMNEMNGLESAFPEHGLAGDYVAVIRAR